MSPAEQCPLGRCDGSGLLIDEQTQTARPCGCHDQLVARRRARGLRSVIPRRYRGLSFERPPITTIRPQIVAAVRSYVRGLDDALSEGRGLWLFGPVGTGKTSLAMLVSEAALAAGHSVAVYSLPRLLAEIRTTFDEDAASSYTGLLDRLTSVDLLHIDDVGAEKTSPWVLEQLYALINSRYEEQRAVMITTNLDRDELAEQIGERTVSRLEEMCTILPVGGVDLRRQDFAPPASEASAPPASEASAPPASEAFAPAGSLAAELGALADDAPQRWEL
ncbi:MAG: ATP-binding protein [Baekduia sp.]